MHAPSVIEHRPTKVSRVVAVAPPQRSAEQQRDRARRSLAVHAIAPPPPTWEQVLVAAGLDRESRELSPAERWLAHRRARSS